MAPFYKIILYFANLVLLVCNLGLIINPIFSIKSMLRIFSYFLVLFLIFSKIALADQNYFLENIIASGSGESASEARDTAVKDANRSAFSILLGRLNISKNIIDDFSDEEISDMIGSKQVKNEKIAGNDYSARINIIFAKDFVDYALEQKKLKKQGKVFEESAIIIAAENRGGRFFVWEKQNHWKNSLNKIIDRKGLDKLIVPGNETDLSRVTSRNINMLEYKDLQSIISHYKANSAYILVYNFDKKQNKATIDLANIRKFQTKLLKLSFVNIDQLTNHELVEKVAKKTISFILHRQKERSKNPNSAKVVVKIDDISDWVTAKRRIEKSQHIDNFRIDAISQDYVVISVNYASNEIDIENLFAKIGLSLKEDSENSYITHAN